MNISPITIYFWQLADRLSPPFIVLAVILGVISIILFVAHMQSNASAAKCAAKNEKNSNTAWLEEQREEEALRDSSLRFLKKTLLGFLASLVISVFTPTSNTIAMMVIIPELAQSKVIQQDLPDLYNAAISALKKQLTPEK